MRTPFTTLLGIENPFVGFNRSPEVVAEVTKAGGFGVLAASTFTPELLDEKLGWIESQVGGRPFGVDVLMPGKVAARDPQQMIASLKSQIPEEYKSFVADLLRRFDVPVRESSAREEVADEVYAGFDVEGARRLLDVAFEHRVGLIASALGTPPTDVVERAHAAGIVVASLVGAAKHAEHQIAAGVDVLVAQGTEAGGHTGTIATMVLTPEIVDMADGRPVLAAGGIASGRQMAAALALGAAGVWTGSVWLNSREDVTPLPVKQKYLAAKSSDTVRSRARTGKPARQLRSAYHDAWEAAGSPEPLPMPLQPMLVQPAWNSIDAAALDGNPGALQLESFFVGQVVGSFEELRGAGEITREIITECAHRLAELGELVENERDRS